MKIYTNADSKLVIGPYIGTDSIYVNMNSDGRITIHNLFSDKILCENLLYTQIKDGSNVVYASYAALYAVLMPFMTAGGGGAGSDIYTSMTTINGSTGGIIVWSMPFRNTAVKEVIIQLNNLTDAGTTITFPAPFVLSPASIQMNNYPPTPFSYTLSTTSIILSATTSLTTWIILKGF